MPLSTKVGLDRGHTVLHRDPASPIRGTAPTFQAVSIVGKRSPISATAEHLLVLATQMHVAVNHYTAIYYWYTAAVDYHIWYNKKRLGGSTPSQVSYSILSAIFQVNLGQMVLFRFLPLPDPEENLRGQWHNFPLVRCHFCHQTNM